MKARIKFFFFYLIFWLSLIISGKIVFLLYQYNQSFSLPLTDWFRIILHGMRLDFSTLGYAVAFPALTISVTSFWKGRVTAWIINVYTFIIIVFFVLVSLTDLEIYRAWSVRFDATPLQFLVNPKEAAASLAWYHILLLLVLAAGIIYLINSFYRKRINILLRDASAGRLPSAVAFFLIFILLFIPVRGGLGTTPINISSAYFHKNIFADQAAINVMWYFGHSVVEGKENKNPYVFFKDDNYAKELESLYSSGEMPVKLLKTDTPIIVLVIMETYTAKLIEPMGGAPGVTPNFNQLSKEGLLFTNLYANGTRTDRGMVSIISGFPTVEPLSVLKYPEKTHKMAFISRDLKNLGYSNAFYYGGDVNFANMKSYLINGGFQKIYSEESFSYHGYRSNWGLPDHVVYDKVIEEIKKNIGLSFHVMLTLSHHEPFDIPGEPHFKGTGIKNKFYSSAYFADSCLGDFVRKMKTTDQWDNCLIIFVADHGSPFPDYSLYHEPAKYKIPMLWLGGALKKDTVISKYCAQSDIAITLLRQLGINNNGYILGKDILSPSSGSFTFYSFMDGMAMMSDSVSFGFDFISNRLLFSEGSVSEVNIKHAKSLQQFVYSYYLSL